MEGPANSQLQVQNTIRFCNATKTKKQPLIPPWDKSCTPAIPPKLTLSRPLASRAITRARWITGGDPSASTWFPVQAALERPFTQLLPALIPPSRTLCRFANWLLIFLKGFNNDELIIHYSFQGLSCQSSPLFLSSKSIKVRHKKRVDFRRSPLFELCF